MKKILFITAFFTVNALSQEIDLHGRVCDFFHEFTNGNTHKHGTQFIGEDTTTSDTMDLFQSSERNGGSFSSKFSKGTLCEYIVESQSYSLNDVKKLQGKKGLQGVTISIGANKDEFLLNVLNNQRKAVRLDSIDEYKKIALQEVKSYLPWIPRDIEYENYYQEFRNQKLDTVEIRFRRIFNNGIVRGNISYIKVHFDTCGNVCSIAIKWPKFVSVANRRYEDFVPIVEAGEKARGLIKERYSEITREDTGKKFHLTHGLIDGVSVGWFPSDISGKIVLTPCYSFSFGTDYQEDGVKINDLIDIPVFRRYYE